MQHNSLKSRCVALIVIRVQLLCHVIFSGNIMIFYIMWYFGEHPFQSLVQDVRERLMITIFLYHYTFMYELKHVFHFRLRSSTH